jgi:YMGG-like Gly-zipper
MRVRTLTLVVAASLTLAACGETTGTRTVSGGLIGTAGGAAIGAMAGNAGLGAAIGAGVGLAGGYLYDQQKKGNLNF